MVRLSLNYYFSPIQLLFSQQLYFINTRLLLCMQNSFH